MNMVSMDLTIDIPNALYRWVKAKSVQGQPVREVVVNLLPGWIEAATYGLMAMAYFLARLVSTTWRSLSFSARL